MLQSVEQVSARCREVTKYAIFYAVEGGGQVKALSSS
jgi:hypothetical protein